MNTTPYLASKHLVRRLFTCMFRQKSKTRKCPQFPHFEGKRVLVTGGYAGVGEFVSRGMLERGAQVTSLARGISKGKNELPEVDFIKCDLSDLSSVVNAVDELEQLKFDVLVCNSGIALREHVMTNEDLEMTFAVNVLGHHLLYRLMLERGMFNAGARIVMTTGEAYCAADKCESNPETYRVDKVYGGSKLGNLWQVLELVKRYPNISAFSVHPGVILSSFGGGIPKGIRRWFASKILITEEQGAQAALIAATQELENGTYWHNVCGAMSLPENDAALDREKSALLWQQLEVLIHPYLKTK